VQETGLRNAAYGADKFGLQDLKGVHWNLLEAPLYEHAIANGEANIVAGGALCAQTGHHTGRSPKDKHTVVDALTEKSVWWAGNRKLSSEHFENLYRDILKHAKDKTLFAQDLYGGANPKYRIQTRVYTELAWHSLFIRTLLIRPNDVELESFVPELTIIDLPSFRPDAKRHGGREGSDTMVAIDFSRKIVLICGSSYAGEMKKSVFTTLNFYLPAQGVMPMHCSANFGPNGDSALFFGLSGTGKTTLSADPNRTLIGDDEHGWSDTAVFNFEGGCYAKMIRLSAEAEPQIYATTKRFGTVLENVVMNAQTRLLDFDDASLTENTRGAYSIECIDNAVLEGVGGHPENIVMLTADAYGVLPPIARLTPEGAMYHYLSGYTAKVAGTEKGVTEPTATFSTCFGAPFLPLNPNVYAQQLGERIAKYQARVWLVNTGWTGGPHGVGSRMKIAYTRAMIRAALSGKLDHVGYQRHPVFNIEMPTSCVGVPAAVLDPRGTWADKAAYDQQAAKLARMFVENFKTFEKDVPASIKDAGPRT
jgi:phosphoenolpyruvate carboxykinase (ATP)